MIQMLIKHTKLKFKYNNLKLKKASKIIWPVQRLLQKDPRKEKKERKVLRKEEEEKLPQLEVVSPERKIDGDLEQLPLEKLGDIKNQPGHFVKELHFKD